MNDFKNIIEDVKKSDIISDKVIEKIIGKIGQEEWQELHDKYSDIMTTAGEVVIVLRNLELENERLEKRICELQSDLLKEWHKNEKIIEELKNEKQLNAEIKKRLIEVEYDCEEFNHEYCDINCNGKRKKTIDLYQLISDGLNETLLKQKEDEIKELKEVIKNLRCCENCIDYIKLFETKGCDCENLSNWRIDNEKKN